MNQPQQDIIENLREENRVLREQLGHRRLRFSDDPRRRLAVRAKGLERKFLAEIASLVTPETLLAWPEMTSIMEKFGLWSLSCKTPDHLPKFGRLWRIVANSELPSRLASTNGKSGDTSASSESCGRRNSMEP
jgi:hypothetical protein